LRTASSLASWSSADKAPQSPAPCRESRRAGSAPCATRSKGNRGGDERAEGEQVPVVHDFGGDEDGSPVRGEAENAGGALGWAARLVGRVDGVPPAGGDECGHGGLLTVSGGSGAEQGPSLLRWERKGPGSPVGVKRRVGPSEEAKPGGRAELARRRRSRRPARRRHAVSA
jgi:hypothetical protein